MNISSSPMVRQLLPLIISIVTVLICVLYSSLAYAFPEVEQQHDTNDDATLYLRVLDTAINNDSRTWCELRLVVTGARIPLTADDTATIGVYRKRSFVQSDILLWEHRIIFTAANATAGRYEQTFDCTSALGEFTEGDTINLYAKGIVEKEQCGFWCRYDRPSTDTIPIIMVTDDEYEVDSSLLLAQQMGLGLSPLRIARDQDWLSFALPQASRILLDAVHQPGHGRLDLTLLNDSGEVVRHGQDGNARSYIEDEVLEEGTYYIRVAPRVQEDFNFYKVNFLFTTVQQDCANGATEEQPCGYCGQRTRQCQSGQWGEWSECQSQGVCQAGTTRKSPCGLCGTTLDTCSSSCQWVAGACEEEGPCNPGVVEEQMCGDGGTQQRRCDNDCQWSNYDECLVEKRLGDSCTSDSDCIDGWECIGGDDDPMFIEGYCGLRGCKSDDECSVDSYCTEVFSRTYCLKRCNYSYDCRLGYMCESNEDDRKVCIPECTQDTDCRVDEQRCSVALGICVDDGPKSDEQDDDLIDTTDDIGVENGCACNGTNSNRPISPMLLIVLGGLAVWSRRRYRLAKS